MLNILILDASFDLLQLYMLIFKNDNLNVIGCQSIDSLFECLQKSIPNLIIIDIVPTGISMDFIHKNLRERNALKTIPVIITSTSGSLIQGYERYGIDGAIEKPFDVSVLISKVKSLLPLQYVKQ